MHGNFTTAVESSPCVICIPMSYFYVQMLDAGARLLKLFNNQTCFSSFCSVEISVHHYVNEMTTRICIQTILKSASDMTIVLYANEYCVPQWSVEAFLQSERSMCQLSIRMLRFYSAGFILA